MLFASIFVVVALRHGAWSNILPQGPFSVNRTSDGLSNTLHSLSEDRFTALQHPLFKHHRVRVKKTRFCDGGVQCVISEPFALLLIVSGATPAS